MSEIKRQIKATFWHIHNTDNPDDLDTLLPRYWLLLKEYNIALDEMILEKLKKSS
jgi:hypothetical protein